MTTLTKRFTGVVLVCSGLVAAAAAASDSGSSYKLFVLPGGGGLSLAYGINATGQVVGSSDVEGDATQRHSFYWFNGETTDLDNVVHFVLRHPYYGVGVHQSFAVSNGGQVVGTAQVKIKCGEEEFIVQTAYLLMPAVLTDFATPYPGDAVINLGTLNSLCTGHDSAAVAISNANHVVGWADYDSRAGTMHAFLVTPVNGNWYVAGGNGGNGLMIDLGTLDPESSVSSATGVNDDGVVVGYSYTRTNTLNDEAGYHAFRVEPQGGVWFVDGDNDNINDLMEDIGTLGGLNSWARGINNDELIVGESDTEDRHTRGFVWENGDMTALATLGGDNSSASAINDADQIVGWAETASGERHAAMWKNGRVYDLNNELLATDKGKITLVEARDINNHGQIVGWGITKTTDGPVSTAFMVRVATADEVAAAEEFLKNQQNEDTPSSSGGSSGGNSNDNTDKSGGTDGGGVPITGVPGNVGSGSDGSSGGSGSGDGGASGPSLTPPALCGAGLVSLAPLTIAGLVLMRRRGSGR